MRRSIIMLGTVLCLTSASKVIAGGDHAGGQEGMQVNIDPKTGQFLNEPPAPKPVPRAARVAEQAPLEIKEGPTKAHGQMVDLNGRFQHEMNIQVAPNGKKASSCDQKPQ